MSHYYYFSFFRLFISFQLVCRQSPRDFLILTQALSTAEQVVGKISLGNGNISVSFVWFCSVT